MTGAARVQVVISHLLLVLITSGHAKEILLMEGVSLVGRMMTTVHLGDDRALDIDARLNALRVATALLPHGDSTQVTTSLNHCLCFCLCLYVFYDGLCVPILCAPAPRCTE